MKFVATSVPAEIVVVLEDKDARVWTGVTAVEVCRGKPADSAADDHEIVGFPRALRLGGSTPERAIAKLMRNFKRAGMISAQTGKVRRLVARVARRNSLLEKRILRRTIRTLVLGEQARPRHERCTKGDGDTVQKITAGDLAVHPQFVVA